MTKRFQRQSFLGSYSEETLQQCCAGIVGLGGGGSHIVQQLAHIGVGQFVIADDDHVEESNLNRLVGATATDAREKRLKVAVARRVIEGLKSNARVDAQPKLWQECAESFRDCDVIFGCLDTFSARAELETLARRFLIPYIDIGMDVHNVQDHFGISGQVILSMPDRPCLRCMGFLNDDLLAAEAQNYGAAGGRPQVIWPNAVLASLAIGMFMQLVTPWSPNHQPTQYLEYDGNSGIVRPSNRLDYLQSKRCSHFDGGDNLGDPFYGVHATS